MLHVTMTVSFGLGTKTIACFQARCPSRQPRCSSRLTVWREPENGIPAECAETFITSGCSLSVFSSCLSFNKTSSCAVGTTYCILLLQGIKMN